MCVCVCVCVWWASVSGQITLLVIGKLWYEDPPMAGGFVVSLCAPPLTFPAAKLGLSLLLLGIINEFVYS